MRFADSRAKIDRANKHILDIEGRLAGLEHSVVGTVQVNPNGGNEVIKYDLEDVSIYEDVALMLGDAVHNLKCALDYAWATTIARVIPAMDIRFIKFPVHPTIDSLETALVREKIDFSSKRLYELLLAEIQPYKAGNFAIWEVHQLDKRDKHRLLIPVIQYSSASGIDAEDEMGILRKGGFTIGIVEDFPHFVHMPPGWHVKDKGKLSIRIMFQHGEAGEESRTVDTPRLYSRLIEEVVQRLERFVETV